MAFDGLKSSSLGATSRQVDSSKGQAETVAGDLWTIKRDGEDWPVIICDEEIVLDFFKNRVRPFNARQTDGTWSKEYKPGGNRMAHRCYPAILLGKMKLYVWSSFLEL